MWISCNLIIFDCVKGLFLTAELQLKTPSEMAGSFLLIPSRRLNQMSEASPTLSYMTNSASNKFVAALATTATPFALGAFMLAWSPSDQFYRSDPKHDGYVQPSNFEA